MTTSAARTTAIPSDANRQEFAKLQQVLKPVMKAIASAVGPHCEVVLHDLTRRELDHTIVEIENGHVTGRTVGGPATDRGLELFVAEQVDHDEYGYAARTGDGRELTASSVYFRGPDGHVIGALCINVDLTPFQNARAALGAIVGRDEERPPPREIITSDITGVLDDLIDAAVAATGKSPALMKRTDRIQVLRYLEGKGAFHVKRAVDRVARRLGVSRVTAYNYLEEIRSAG